MPSNLDFKHLESICLVMDNYKHQDIITLLAKCSALKSLHLIWHWTMGCDGVESVKQALYQCLVDNPDLTHYGNYFQETGDFLSCLFPVNPTMSEYLDVEIDIQVQKNRQNHWLRKASLFMRAAEVAKTNLINITFDPESLPEHVVLAINGVTRRNNVNFYNR